MRRPLYGPFHTQMPSLPEGGHSGLWYDKFCNQWADTEWKLYSDSKRDGKRDWISTVTRAPVGQPARLQESVDRMLDMVSILGGTARFCTTRGRFVTGLGRSHPLENGFAWHPTLGVPFLPGSSVKGLVRSWVEVWLGQEASAEHAARVFGPRDPSTPRQAGTVIFFDALPVAPVRLEMEVMTPHYADYYSKPDCPPADWYNPVPINFLTVAGGQSFVFAVAARDTDDESEDLAIVVDWMMEALRNIGAGAKTAAGYGRFVYDEQSTLTWEGHQRQEVAERETERRAQEERQALARLSPLRREMEEDGYSRDNTDDFMFQLTKKWLDRMEEATPADRREIARLLLNWYEAKLPHVLRKPNKKNEEKIKRIMRTLGD